jgi:hypothetical protein
MNLFMKYVLQRLRVFVKERFPEVSKAFDL